jgi:hypothetical protein
MNTPDPKELTDKANAAIRVLRQVYGNDPLDSAAVAHYDVEVIYESNTPKSIYIRKDDKMDISAEFIIQGASVVGVTFDLGGLGRQVEGETQHMRVADYPLGPARPAALEVARTAEAEEPQIPVSTENPNIQAPKIINPQS